MSDEAHAEAPLSNEPTTLQPGSRRSDESREAARRAFREALDGDKSTPVETEPAEPDEPMPAWLDPEVARMRRELSAKHESLGGSGPSLDDLLDRPGRAVRTWLESARGEKFASDEEFKTEVSDLVTRLCSDELGVPLPANVRTKLDSAAARKSLKHLKSTEAKREAERAERQAHDAEWSRAAGLISQQLASGSDKAKAYPLLAAERDPGQTVTDIIRAGAESGETLTWEAAAKLAEKHLRRTRPKPAATTPPKPAVAKAPTPAVKAPPRHDLAPSQLPTFTPPSRRRNEDTRRAETLAALRRAHDEG